MDNGEFCEIMPVISPGSNDFPLPDILDTPREMDIKYDVKTGNLLQLYECYVNTHAWLMRKYQDELLTSTSKQRARHVRAVTDCLWNIRKSEYLLEYFITLQEYTAANEAARHMLEKCKIAEEKRLKQFE
jgi:hypothetical protein